MKEREMDFLVVFSSYPEREGHIEYLTGYHSAFPPSQYDERYRGLGYSALLLSRTSRVVLFPCLLFASGTLVGVDKVMASENLPLSVANSLSNLLNGNKRRIGLVGTDVIPSLYLEELKAKLSRNIRQRFVVADSLLVGERMTKSSAELSILRRGSKIADIGIEAAVAATKEGVRESEIALAAMTACYNEGADYVARTRIYGNKVSSVRWPIMTNRRLKGGEITGIDLVGWYEEYGFDVMRRWTVGSPNEEQRDLLGKAAALTELTAKRIRPGMTGDEVCKASVNAAAEIGIPRTSAKPFGHAIGLEIVEEPILLPRATTPLRESAFVCIEPGVESESFGSVHIEDEVVIQRDGSVEIVSKCPRVFV